MARGTRGRGANYDRNCVARRSLPLSPVEAAFAVLRSETAMEATPTSCGPTAASARVGGRSRMTVFIMAGNRAAVSVPLFLTSSEGGRGHNGRGREVESGLEACLYAGACGESTQASRGRSRNRRAALRHKTGANQATIHFFGQRVGRSHLLALLKQAIGVVTERGDYICTLGE